MAFAALAAGLAAGLACPANAGIDNAKTATTATAINRIVRNIFPPAFPEAPAFPRRLAFAHAEHKGDATRRGLVCDWLTGSATVTFMQVTPAATADAAAHDRPTAARSPRRLALGTRLTIYVTLSVAAVITAITFV